MYFLLKCVTFSVTFCSGSLCSVGLGFPTVALVCMCGISFSPFYILFVFVSRDRILALVPRMILNLCD